MIFAGTTFDNEAYMELYTEGALIGHLGWQGVIQSPSRDGEGQVTSQTTAHQRTLGEWSPIYGHSSDFGRCLGGSSWPRDQITTKLCQRTDR